MHVYFCLRRDAFSKKGGDSLKVGRYVKALAEMGVSSSVFTDPSELPASPLRASIVHIFNTQVPFENLKYFYWAKKHNLYFVFSTIHHSHHYMEKYLCVGLFKRLMGLSFLVYLQALGKELLVYKTLNNLRAFLFSPGGINKKLLKGSDYLFPLSLQEKAHLERDFEINIPSKKIEIVPNGITYHGCNGNSYDNRAIDVVVVGRIEPRKNQLKLAEILSTTSYKTIFVGASNGNHSRYFDCFLRIINASKNLNYAGEKDYEEIKNIYSNAKVSLSNSCFEVVSQVDLEAISLGCKPIVSEASAIFDYFKNGVLSLSPDAAKPVVLSQLEKGFESSYLPALKDGYYLSWSQVAVQLAQAYSKCVYNPGANKV